jgi:fused-like protein
MSAVITTFPYFVNDYILLCLKGSGSFGKLYKARKKYTGYIVALKFIPKNLENQEDNNKLLEEVNILRKCSDIHIIQFIDNFDTETDFVIVTEFGEDDLMTILNDDGRFCDEDILYVARQLTSALVCCTCIFFNSSFRNIFMIET